MKLQSSLSLTCLCAALVAGCSPADQSPRNVVLLVGDGLGAGQMALAIQYARRVEGRRLHLEQLMHAGNTGYTLPDAYGSHVTDSAAAASQLATGVEARNETLGLDSSGNRVETILEWAETRGLATGLVTNMRLTHATPASFAAHIISRYEPESAILDQILLDHEIEVLLGGGAQELIPAGQSVSDLLPGVPPELDGPSSRLDDLDRIADAREAGYTIVSSRQELEQASRAADKLLGLYAAANLPYVLDSRAMGLDSVPSLEDSTRAALEVLSRSEAGFFLVVEGGRIDYAGHDNDAGAMLHEILDFDAAVGAAMAFQDEHPETLVVVTADHGTGGITSTYIKVGEPDEAEVLPGGLTYQTDTRYPNAGHLESVGRQSASFDHMLETGTDSPEQLIDTVREYTGLSLTMDEATKVLARDSAGDAWLEEPPLFHGNPRDNRACLLGRALGRHTFIAWSTGGHTSEPVLTFGRGPGAERLRGIYQPTHVHEVMKHALER